MIKKIRSHMMVLMHKDIPVAELSVIHGQIQDVTKIYNKNHMPVGTGTEFLNLRGRILENWNKMREMSQERQDIKKIEQMINCSVVEEKIKNMAISLTDCYWLKDTKSQLEWRNVNYHKIKFASDFSQTLLYGSRIRDIDGNIPDWTTDGALKKTWVNSDGKPVLLKFGSLSQKKEDNLQCANEVAASKIADMMGIFHVSYFLMNVGEGQNTICGCECFISDESTEFVNGLQVLKEQKGMNGIGLYKAFENMGMRKEVDKMILFDHIIHNIDRHEKNFGFLRDADTLEIIGFAPLFDSGSSLGWSQAEMKPFLCGREDQLSLINKIGDIPEPGLIKAIIQESYKDFDISDESFDAACREIDISYRILTSIGRSFYINFKD